MPRNWLRPRIDYLPAASENLFEMIWTVAGFAHPLRVYTRDRNYTLDKALWDQMRTSINDTPISVTVKALELDRVRHGPAGLRRGRADQLRDRAGRRARQDRLLGAGRRGRRLAQGIRHRRRGDAERARAVAGRARKTATETCIGCHAATPDGNGVGFALGEGFYFDSVADIRQGQAGTVPAYVTPTALAHDPEARRDSRLLAGALERRRSHRPAQRHGDLHWIQLDGTNQGIVARTGDTSLATEPTFRHDGTAIVYVSGNSIIDGRSDGRPDRSLRGAVRGRRGRPRDARSPARRIPTTPSTIPAFSPDDALVAFTRISGAGDLVQQHRGRGAGGSVGGRHGPATEGERRAGVSDQSDQPWPDQRLAQMVTGRWPGERQTYYWLTFSSQANGQRHSSSSPPWSSKVGTHLDVPGALSLEPADRRGKPHALVGQLPDPADYRALIFVRDWAP